MQDDVLQNMLMSLERLVTRNGGRMYGHAIKRVVVSLIPLKIASKMLVEERNLVKIKNNNHN